MPMTRHRWSMSTSTKTHAPPVPRRTWRFAWECEGPAWYRDARFRWHRPSPQQSLWWRRWKDRHHSAAPEGRAL